MKYNLFSIESDRYLVNNASLEEVFKAYITYKTVKGDSVCDFINSKNTETKIFIITMDFFTIEETN